MVLNEHIKAFVMHVTFLSTIAIHLARKAQIVLLITEEVKIPTKYSDFLDVFSKAKASILSEITELNQHVIKLYEDQQPLYGLIYSLGSVELETLKTYIETNLANGFIWPLKSLAGTPILFVKKPNNRFCLCMDYWSQ